MTLYLIYRQRGKKGVRELMRIFEDRKAAHGYMQGLSDFAFSLSKQTLGVQTLMSSSNANLEVTLLQVGTVLYTVATIVAADHRWKQSLSS